MKTGRARRRFRYELFIEARLLVVYVYLHKQATNIGTTVKAEDKFQERMVGLVMAEA